jgi:hypothetical protein
VINKLVSVFILSEKREAIYSLFKDSIHNETIEDVTYGAPFLNYLAFSQQSALALIGRADLSQEEILYNRYYWFLKFIKLYMSKHGYDAGLEQQAFKMLEHATCDIDWSVVEEISALVGRIGQDSQ